MLNAYYTSSITQPKVPLLTVQSFINQKSTQLIYYMHAYWHDDMPYAELENFMWDSLEEWTQVDDSLHQLYSHKERIFWYLFHQTQFVSAEDLKHDLMLRHELEFCLRYLENNRLCPIDVVGMRP